MDLFLLAHASLVLSTSGAYSALASVFARFSTHSTPLYRLTLANQTTDDAHAPGHTVSVLSSASVAALDAALRGPPYDWAFLAHDG